MSHPQDYDPHPDDLARDQLAEHDLMWATVCDALYDWHYDVIHNNHTSKHGVGSFLDFLADKGYRVTPIEPMPPIEELFPAAKD